MLRCFFAGSKYTKDEGCISVLEAQSSLDSSLIENSLSPSKCSKSNGAELGEMREVHGKHAAAWMFLRSD